MQGIYTPASKTLIIKETGLIELEIGDKSQPCLMTCYLDYSKMGKLEVLQGSFISVNLKDKGDCGSGKVYLERVAKSDFKPEDFLLKKKPSDSSTTSKSTKPAVPATPNSKLNSPDKGKSNATTNPKQSLKNSSTKTINAPKTKPGAEKNLVPTVKSLPPTNSNSSTVKVEPIKTDSIPSRPKEVVSKKTNGIPKVLIERENNLVRTIQTDENFIQLDLYDNGTIDHDSISVFHNNVQVVINGGLSYTPITLKIKMSKEDPRHEFIMVAENMGEIPPNTALMVITAGKKRYEIFLTSTEEKNAKVIIEYKPKE
jgi:hypothetical protein